MSDTGTIRDMTADHIDAVTALEREIFSDPWPRSAFHEILTVANRINLVLIAPEGHLGGYVLGQVVLDELQVQNIAVAPAARRRGWGALLLHAVEQRAKERGALCAVLDVRSQNAPALGLYQRFGYRMIGRRKNYYRRPVDDALVLFRRLDRDDNLPAGEEPDHGMVP